MTATEELRAKLNERGINWWPDKYYRDTNTCWRVGDFEWRASERKYGKLLISLTYLTPEQAIAATVGVIEDEADARDLMEAIRDDDGVRYSMDEVMDIMRKDVAVTVGNAQEPSNAVIERIERFCTDYAQCLVDATLHDKRPFDEVDHRTCGSMAAVEAKLIRELAEDIATVGAGTCKNTQNDFDFMCSECGKCVDNGRVLGFKFCPNCGRPCIG